MLIHDFADDTGLTGSIPSELMNLKELSELVLGKHAQLCNFFCKENILISRIFLDHNSFTGTIPDFQPENKLKIVSMGKFLLEMLSCLVLLLVNSNHVICYRGKFL